MTVAVVTENLLSTRGVMRRFWGEKYAGRVAEFQPILRAVMKHRSCGPLPALKDILATMQNDYDSGMLQGLMISAAVEMIEQERRP